MKFIEDKKLREEIFFKLWNEEIKINTNHYELVFGNDIFIKKGITREELKEIFDFCDRYHTLFKYVYKKSDKEANEKQINYILESLKENEVFLIKHLFDY